MVIFLTNRIEHNTAFFEGEEYKHAIKVLRHKKGDIISFIDGIGTRYLGDISAVGSREFSVNISEKNYEGELPYKLHLAVAPTKNLERYEWFVEKAVELGLDEITPVIGNFSERKIFKTERAKRIVLSAVKQSLKSYIPRVNEAVSVVDFIESVSDSKALKLIGYCEEVEKLSLFEVLKNTFVAHKNNLQVRPEIIIMIGPEGDFSEFEVKYALNKGFVVINLGKSRLRTETAAITSVTAVYLYFADYFPNIK